MGFTLQTCAIYGYYAVTSLDCAFKASCTFVEDSMNLDTKVHVTLLEPTAQRYWQELLKHGQPCLYILFSP